MKHLLIFGIVFTATSSCHSINKGKAEIPSFNLMLQDSTTIFNTQAIPEGGPTVLIFFSPDCDHCQRETADILGKMDSLKNVRFYFVSFDPIERLKVFNGYYKIHKYTNVVVGRDYTYAFPKYFKDALPPFSVIYDKDKRLRAVYKGETTASQFISVINNL